MTRSGRTAAQGQAQAEGTQAIIQRSQAMVQPPARGCSRRAHKFGLLVEHVDRHDWAARTKRRDQCGIVGQAKIAAEPDEDIPLIRDASCMDLCMTGIKPLRA
ncbi:hypothetical protein RSO01_39330 [Reyranella soli]|uniref:Uncharacterized protein n=1 Tax=Reyranella soli TaxID=1230389 RepID=A0A512NCT9_9HYPH|nr:hypothetical protein RSO01_39330 [Reyranella soli]